MGTSAVLRFTLRAAAVYNLAFGVWAVGFPRHFWALAGLAQPNYPELWQCIGMIVGVYGVGYWIAARDPERYWPIVLVGLLGKVLGPLGFARAAMTGALPWSFGWINVFNDLVWWIPFTWILVRAWRHHHSAAVT
jgi:hypothetical protein